VKRRGRGLARSRSAYDETPYPTAPYPPAHPDSLAAVAHLHGLSYAEPSAARYVDLGCGDGGNLLAVASSLPETSCAGVDASAAAIGRGRTLRSAAGLERVELRRGDLGDRGALADLGPADYVVLHGVWSWVAEDAREAALVGAAGLLAPDGVLLVSYNALPGWHLLEATRALARRNDARGPAGDPAARAAAARKAVELAARLHARDDAYGRLLAEAAERYAQVDPAVLVHDDLADTCEAFALEEVVARAEEHGLRYLGEALAEQWWQWRLPHAGGEQVRRAAGADAVARQQWADLASGTAHKATLFVRTKAQPSAEIDPERALDLFAAAPLDPPPDRPEEPEALRAFAGAMGLEALPVRELARRAAIKEETAARAALQLTAEGRATLHVHPLAFAQEAGERPRVSALARAQVAMGEPAATLRHAPLRLDESLGPLLVSLLDGTRDRQDLAGAIAARAPELGISNASVEQVRASLEGPLKELARVGLLCE
jgi:SAM-dependent methyltransferase